MNTTESEMEIAQRNCTYLTVNREGDVVCAKHVVSSPAIEEMMRVYCGACDEVDEDSWDGSVSADIE